MAIIKCPECGNQVSELAPHCPKCGVQIYVPTEEYICCPKCGSKDVESFKKGFSGKKAVVGAVLVGGIGLLAGTIGSKDIMLGCRKCGNKFKAGEGKVVRVGTNAKSDLDIYKSELKSLLERGQYDNAILKYKTKENILSYSKAADALLEFARNNNVNIDKEKYSKFQNNQKNKDNIACVNIIIIVVFFIALICIILFH